MAKVTGLGGAFIRSENPKELYQWYVQHFGLELSDGCFTFKKEVERAKIVVAFFSKSSDYFPVSQPAMLNFQVDDLDALLAQLASAGVVVDPHREDFEFGRFAWVTDPEGNRVELWQPPDAQG